MADSGTTVVITGGTAGVGRATPRRFAQDGARIALLARDSDRLDATRRELEEMGAAVLALPTDVADPDRVEAAAKAVEEGLGETDIWINDAMVTIYAEFLDIDPDEFRRATEVTYHGTVWGTRAALQRMVPRDRGTVVQVGSAMAYSCQQTGQPLDPEGHDNLFEPASGDRGAHGPFDDQAHAHSPQLWLTRRRGPVALAVAAVSAAAVGTLLRRS
ncbi:MAG TPA: SDR family NAD(P)-dependent oxidoreductase [Euzebyales bacterium]|nr:SDR family NAD(P)-dependent oxidoreductase [Euzebyales bacterium]